MAPSKFTKAQYRFLLLASWVSLLPLLTVLVCLNYGAVVLLDQKNRLARHRGRLTDRKTVLITGTRNTYGLDLARALNRAGHRVIGADPDTKSFLNVAKRSRAISKHYLLPHFSAAQDSSYIARCILTIVRTEAVSLWVDCSQDVPADIITAARADIEQSSSCVCFALDNRYAERFENKESFVEFLRERSLPAPEHHQIKNRGQIHNILNAAQGKKQYLLTSSEQGKPCNPQTLLPRRTLSQTYNDVARIKIPTDSRLVLEECMDTSVIYETLAVVVNGTVTSFWARRRAVNHSQPLPKASALSRAMLTFTKSVAQELGTNFSNHLLLQFGLHEGITHKGVMQQIIPIRGSMRLDTSFVLEINRRGFQDLAQGYMLHLRGDQNGALGASAQKLIGTDGLDTGSQDVRERYVLPNVFEELLLKPCIGLLLYRTSAYQALDSFVTLLYTVTCSDEAFYDSNDPLPAFWQYSVVLFWNALRG